MITNWIVTFAPMLGTIFLFTLPAVIFFEIMDWALFRKKIERRKTFLFTLVLFLVTLNAVVLYAVFQKAPGYQFYAMLFAIYSVICFLEECILHLIYLIVNKVATVPVILRVFIIVGAIVIFLLGGAAFLTSNYEKITFKKLATQHCGKIQFGIPDGWNADPRNDVDTSMVFTSPSGKSSISVKVLGKKEEVLGSTPINAYLKMHIKDYEEELYAIEVVKNVDLKVAGVTEQSFHRYDSCYIMHGTVHKPTKHYFVGQLVEGGEVYEITYVTTMFIGGKIAAEKWVRTIQKFQ